MYVDKMFKEDELPEDTFPLYTRLKHTNPALAPLLATILCFNHPFSTPLKHTAPCQNCLQGHAPCFNPHTGQSGVISKCL